VQTSFGVIFDSPNGNSPFEPDIISGTVVDSVTTTSAVGGSFTALAPGDTIVKSPPTRTHTPANTATFTSASTGEALAFFIEVQSNGAATMSCPVSTKVGLVTSTTGGNLNIVQSTQAAATIEITYTYTAAVSGDPQIVGFQGQRYQIHGIPDEHFALLSTPSYFMNGRFTYIANGVCNYNDTECFSHAGTYISELGIVTGNNQLKLVAGSHEHGLQVYLNNELVTVGVTTRLSMDSMVRVISKSRAKIVFSDVTITVANSDHFFNLGADFTDAQFFEAGHKQLVISTSDAKQAAIQIAHTYPEYNMHGLLGQTWRNIVWPHQRLYEGEPTDYQTNGIFGSEFIYSQFMAPNSQ
jgi:hypothetical protein